MSEDHTQPPSKHRRQLAREQGQAAHSPELTAAAGWLVAVVLLGDSAGPGEGDGRPGAHCRWRFRRRCRPMRPASRPGFVAWPGPGLAARVHPGGFAAGALAAHQLQVRGLWLSRFDRSRSGAALDAREGTGVGLVGNVAWATVKALVVVMVLGWPG